MSELWNVRAEIMVQPKTLPQAIPWDYEHRYLGQLCRNCTRKDRTLFQSSRTWHIVGVERLKF